MSIRTSLTLAALVVAASPLAAQGRGNGAEKVPPGHMPPPGMCRIWIDDVPPGRQPKPTDCATARRRVPDNARVIYGARRTASRDDVRWTDRVMRERDGRYDDDRKSESVGDRKDADGDDRKYDDRKDDDTEVFRRGDDVKDRDDDDDRRDSDTKLSDRKDSTRKP